MNKAMHSDGELLQQFAASGEQAAFEALVDRHSSLVYGTCCRILGRSHDAEDAAQAVFLTLAHKAGSLRHHTSIAGWLHRVAMNVSLRTREAAECRSQHEREVGAMNTDTGTEQAPDPEWEELRPLLDGELNRLPEKYRILVILHYIEGRSQEEIAVLLGCTYGTVSGRLNHARTLLRERLNRRRLALSASALFLMLPRHAPVAMPVTIAASSVKAAALIAAGNAAAPGLVSTQAAALTQGALKHMYIAKLKIAAAVLVSVLAVGSAGAATYRSLYSATAPTQQTEQAVTQSVPARLETPHAPVVQAASEVADARPAQPTPVPAPEPAGPKDADQPAPVPAPAEAQADAPADAQAAAPDKKEIAAWIIALSHPDEDRRTEAYLKLRKAGEAAREGLEGAAKSKIALTADAAQTLLKVLKVKPYLDEVEQHAKGVTTVQAEIKSSEQAKGLKATATGSLKYKLTGNKSITNLKMTFAGLEMTKLWVNDGTTLWVETNLPMGEEGMKEVIKFPASYRETISRMDDCLSPIEVKQFSEQYDFTTVAEGNFEGKPAYVLTGHPHPGLAEQAAKKAKKADGDTAATVAKAMTRGIAKVELMIGKEDHLFHRFETFNKNGGTIQMMEMSQVKLNEALDDGLFIYCPPAGVKVEDGMKQIKMMEAMEAEENAEAPAPPLPPTAPNF